MKEEPDFLARINDHLTRDETHQVHRAAHTLKGFAAMCGAVGVADAAAALEQAALQKQGNLSSLAVRLAREYAASRATLKGYCS